MRAWRLERTGPPDVLALRELPDPTPGPGEVRVRVEAIGLNYAEILSRKGLYGWAPPRPYTLGMEATGRIDAVGPGVEREPGETVMVGTQHGAYAGWVVVPQARALSLPARFGLEERAAFGVNFMTAWVALAEMARMRPGDRVLITAAAGGVGTAAVQIAHAAGCEVFALAGTEEKLERVRPLGARETVAYRAPGFQERLTAALGGRGPDVVLEVVGGEVFRACRSALAPFGRLVVAGYAGLDYSRWNPLSWWRAWRDAPRASVTRMAEDSVGIMGTHVGLLLPDESRLLRVWGDLLAFVEEHGLGPVVGRTFDFEAIPQAHAHMESRESVGKIVVRGP